MSNLWQRWTLNCAVGELLGIACAGVIAFGVNSLVGDSQSIASKLIVLVAMMMAGFIEGSILSYYQWRVLVTKFTRIPKEEWFLYTMLVGVLGWFLGMLPSLFFMPELTNETYSGQSIDYGNPMMFALLSIVMGLVLGSIFGLFQWIVLRKYAERAHQWILANALGWGLGLGWIYLFATIPNEHSSLLFIICMGIIGGILAGLSVGAVTGFFVVRLKSKLIYEKN